ncbi:MAG: argininosuccinate synthase [Desulfobacterales bacterium]|nr:argininosuccinate synthase [Desulfobacterales bacterium]
MKKKVVLAYSGGLDTSIILRWLMDEGYDVIAYMADIGQDEDFEAAKEKALSIGACKVYVEDLKREFAEEFIFQALKANTVYEGKYLLGTSLARGPIARKQIEIARAEGTNVVSHGATGKGNDQVRFELAYMTFMPDVQIISPWKDNKFLTKFKGRTDLIEYAEKTGIPIDSTRAKPYSIDENLMHISYEGGSLEDPNFEPDEDMFKRTVNPIDAPDVETKIAIEFKAGVPVKVENLTENKTVEGSLELFQYLNELGSKNGVGRMDLVENRFVGMKSRGVYETPGGAILLRAHLDLEGVTLDREVCHLRDMLMPKIAELIYNGFWFSPEMEFLMAAVDKSQEMVDGTVFMTLYKGNAYATSRVSASSLYDEDIASMDRIGGFDQTDSIGFIRVNATRLRAPRQITGEVE